MLKRQKWQLGKCNFTSIMRTTFVDPVHAIIVSCSEYYRGNKNLKITSTFITSLSPTSNYYNKRLAEVESVKYKDIFLIDFTDTYKNLVYKLHSMYSYIYKKIGSGDLSYVRKSISHLRKNRIKVVLRSTFQTTLSRWMMTWQLLILNQLLRSLGAIT